MMKKMGTFFFFITFILFALNTSLFAAITAKLKAEVLTEKGEPVKGAVITLTFTKGGQGRDFTSDKKGKIFSPFVDVGTYIMKVNYEGHYLSQFNIKVRNRNAELELEETRSLGPYDTVPDIRFQADRIIYLRLTLSKMVVAKKEAELGDMNAPKNLIGAIEEVKGLYQMEKYEDGLKIITDKIEKFPEEPVLYFLKGLLHFKMNNNQQALPALQKCVELNPSQRDANYYLGEISNQLGDSAGAAKYLEKELELNPQNKAILIKLGLMYKKQKEYKKAIPLFEKVIEIDPDEMRAKLELAELYQASGDIKKSNALLSELEEKGVKDAKSYYNLGVGYWNSENFNLAVESFRKAILVEPNLALAHRQMGFCYIKLNEPSEAVTCLQKYLALKPDAADAAETKVLVNKLQKAIK
ncbi:tetratricopeptide repeat protein [candidate division CSSED10-310 bacterium]|uniref:Tetratricopeptide repeat protein n=1 Tax=candidate division CSSED10-310 bacterium TaxID=2855610 RepID=A0ABV6YVS7_UNCC1